MLVALQRTGAAPALPPAAEHLVRLLSSWGPGPDHLTGLALAGITVPSRGGPRFVDAVVFTRCGVVVIAAHQLGVGVLPGERADAGVAAAKGALAGHDGGRYVTGLVAVVPVMGEQATQPALPSEPETIPVVLADARGLRRIIVQHNRWRTVWSVDDVLDACYALSLAHLAPPRAALLADGFPARLPGTSPVPELPAVVVVPPEPPPPPVEDEPVPRLQRAASAVFPRPRPIRQVPWGLLFVLTLLVSLGVVAAVFVAQVFHGS